ncbi:MAG: hypothetical protein ACE5QV_06980, partial [Fidelibacterota bacterium]
MELVKRPKIVKRTFKRKIARVKSVMPRTMRTAAVHGGTVLASLARPTDPVDRTLFTTVDKLDLGPKVTPDEVLPEKETRLINIKEELLDPMNLNTG